MSSSLGWYHSGLTWGVDTSTILDGQASEAHTQKGVRSPLILGPEDTLRWGKKLNWYTNVTTILNDQASEKAQQKEASGEVCY